jgi:hypothetical protein
VRARVWRGPLACCQACKRAGAPGLSRPCRVLASKWHESGGGLAPRAILGHMAAAAAAGGCRMLARGFLRLLVKARPARQMRTRQLPSGCREVGCLPWSCMPVGRCAPLDASCPSSIDLFWLWALRCIDVFPQEIARLKRARLCEPGHVRALPTRRRYPPGGPKPFIPRRSDQAGGVAVCALARSPC